ncbi:biotin synthase [Ceratobasidium sp. 414]|nr:biotin synthase [Ceratobasidium sp. 414]
MLSSFVRSSGRSLVAHRLVARGHATAVQHGIPANASVETPASVRWARDEINKIYHGPLLDLVFRAATVHRQHFDPNKIWNMLISILLGDPAGGCTEDCSYCSQSSRYSTPTTASRLLDHEPVIQAARKAKENGSTRFCMGAAWRDLHGRKSGFKRILEMVTEIRGMGMEVCTTLGMLSPDQARQLKEAGLTAYNHNLDTSREFYPKVITTRSYDERLSTIEAVRDAGINVCSGGILGLGESDEDRIGLIYEVANMPEHPESFPVNALVPIPGTPLEKNEFVQHRTMLRTIATARIAMPSTIIRLSAGRDKFTEAEQAMCFMAGANAVFTGEKMLTTPCASWDEDKSFFSRWGLEGMKSFEQPAVREKELPRYSESRSSNATSSINPSPKALWGGTPAYILSPASTPFTFTRLTESLPCLRFTHLSDMLGFLVFLLAQAQEVRSNRFDSSAAHSFHFGAGSVNMLARVTVIDYYGKVLFDSFVRPTQPVVNYRTTSTGIEQVHVSGDKAQPFDQVQAEVTALINNRIIIGHSIWTDLAVLGIR